MPNTENGRDNSGLTPLHHAAAAGDVDRCRYLLEQGADANVPSGVLVRDGPLQCDWYWDPGATALILAAEAGHADVVHVLLALGGDPTSHDASRWGPLHASVLGADAGLIGLLVEAGASLELSSTRRSYNDQLGWFFVNTPLHLAALRNDVASATALLSCGATLSPAWVDRRTPLMYAAASSSTAVVELLCARGADPHLREHRYAHGAFLDMTPLHYAARNGHADTVAVLIRYGAEARARESYSGLTAGEMADQARAAPT